ncbi:MAG: 30S ribosomal protein S20 [Firmicutes bacterium]|nr:30S ribosomal protein S20 [Bacillota bacterium]
MPNHKSAEKRIYVSQKKKALNRSHNSEVKSTIKKFNNAIDTLNLELAEKLLPEVFSCLDSAVHKGVLHKNNAANRKGSLAKKLHDVKEGKLQITIKKDNKTIAAEKAKAAKEARAKAKAEFDEKAAAERKKREEEEEAKSAAKKEKPKKEKKPKKGEEPAAAEEKPLKVEKEEKTKAAKSPAKAKKEETPTEEKPKKAPAKKPAAKK